MTYLSETLRPVLNVPRVLGEFALRKLQELTPVNMEELNKYIAETGAEYEL